MIMFLRTKKQNKTQRKFLAGMLLSLFILGTYPLLSTRAYVVDNVKIDKQISDEGVTFMYYDLEGDAILPDEEVVIPAPEPEPEVVVTETYTGGSGGGGRYDASNWILQQKYDELVALRDEDWEATHASPPKAFDPTDLATVLLIPAEASDISVDNLEETESPVFVEVESTRYAEANIKTIADIVNIEPDWVERFFTPMKLSFSSDEDTRDRVGCVFIPQNNLVALEKQIQVIQDLIRMFVIIIFFLLLSQLITFLILRREYQDIKDKCDVKKITKKKTKTAKKKTTKKRSIKNLLLLLVLSLIPVLVAPVAQANTFDTEKVYYQGLLKDDNLNLLTGQYDFRFSVWLIQDFQAGEVVAGEIVTTSPQYLDWKEVQTKDIVDGDFLFRIGEILTLPTNLFEDHFVYLQVEVKETAQANKEYEIIDIDGADPLIDRLKYNHDHHLNYL